jgi:hypothetical protein
MIEMIQSTLIVLMIFLYFLGTVAIILTAIV